MAAKDVKSDKIIADQTKQIASLKAQLSAKEAKESDAVKDQVDYSKQILNATTKRLELLNQIEEASAEAVSYQKASIALGLKHYHQTKKEADLHEDMFKNSMKERKLELQAKKDLIKNFKNLKDQADIIEGILVNKNAIQSAQEKLNKSSEKYSESIGESFEFLDSIDNAIKGIPIVGGILSKAIGLDTIKEEITKNFSDAFAKSINGTAAAQVTASSEAIAGFEAQAVSMGLVVDEAAAVIVETEAIAAETTSVGTAQQVVVTGFAQTAAAAGTVVTELAVMNEELLAAGAATGVVAAETGVLAAEFGTAAVAVGVLDVEAAALAPAVAVADVAAVGFGASMWAAAAASAAALAPMLPLIAAAGAVLAIMALIKKAIDVDAEITEFAKKMGVTKEEALETHHHLADVVKDTKVIGANQKAMEEATIDLNAALGTSREISKEMLESQVILTKQYGMSGEAAAEFQQQAAGMGKTAPQMTQEIQRTAEMYNKMTGDSVNFKDITADIAKSSRATTASYKGNVAALTKAAIQAKKIGMSLEDTAGVSANLLDIETSLENTMKANVLTGKHMNMDKARGLALEGKTAEAAAEAVAQAGDYDELLQMAPYKQKAIADAAGLTVDQLMKAGELEKYSQALGGEKIADMKDLTAEQIKQLETEGAISEEKAMQLEQDSQKASAQDKINALTDKLSAIFAQIAGPIAEMIEPLGDLLSFILPAIMPLIKMSFAPLLGVIDMFKGIGKMLDGDIMGGLKDIGEGIMRFFFSPFMLVWDLVAGFFPSITDGIMSIGADLFNGMKKPFMDAYNWIANLFVGNSPSKLGQGILDGIASIGSSLLDFITAPFMAGWDLITGLFSGDIGIIAALKSVGGAIFDTLTAPFTMIMDFIGGLFNVDNLGTMIVDGVKGIGSSIVDGIAGIGSSIVDGVTAPFNSAFDWVSDKASAAMDFLPSWLGGSDDEASEGGATATKVSDAQIDPSGGLVVSGQKGTYQLDKQDSIVAGTDLGKGASVSADTMGLGGLGEIANSIMGGVSSLIGGGSSAPATDNSEMVNILKQILAATSQPVSVNIGGKVIDEIEKQTTLRKTYNTKMDSAHGAF